MKNKIYKNCLIKIIQYSYSNLFILICIIYILNGNLKKLFIAKFFTNRNKRFEKKKKKICKKFLKK